MRLTTISTIEFSEINALDILIGFHLEWRCPLRIDVGIGLEIWKPVLVEW